MCLHFSKIGIGCEYRVGYVNDPFPTGQIAKFAAYLEIRADNQHRNDGRKNSVKNTQCRSCNSADYFILFILQEILAFLRSLPRLHRVLRRRLRL